MRSMWIVILLLSIYVTPINTTNSNSVPSIDRDANELTSYKHTTVTSVDNFENDGWRLPVFPPASRLPPLNQSEKMIPRILWIAVTDKDTGINAQMPALFERNKNWDVRICDNHDKDVFMNNTFANTSLLWAYHMLSPSVGAAKADIWRYAVLWSYGGVYIDDDSDMKVPLDKMIEPEDTLIVSYEKNGFNGDVCYIPKYHLSDFATYGRNESLRDLNIFQGKVLLNWAIVSAQRHPIIARTMENAVEVIRQEFFNEPVLRSLKTAFRWHSIMCATGPSLMTGSARAILLENPPGLKYKLARNDFQDYGGKFKAIYVPLRHDPKHYMNKQQKDHVPLLRFTQPEKPLTPEIIKSWQGTAVQGQNGREIFVIDNGKRRGIPNFDTFLALNFTMADVRVISDSRMGQIPFGDSMDNLSKR